MEVPMRPKYRHLTVREVQTRIQTINQIIEILENDGKLDSFHIYDTKAYLTHYRDMLELGVRKAELPFFFDEIDKSKSYPTMALPD